jgi:predicted small metal-binding protein
MGKVLHAGRVIPGSKQVFTGESETDIIAKMSDYLKREHEIDHLSKDLVERIKNAIEEE